MYSIATALGKIIQRFNQSLNLRMFGQVFVGYLGVYLFINALYWSMETIKVVASFFLLIDVFSLVDSELQTQTTIHWCFGIKIFLGNSGKCTWKSLLLTTCFGKATTLNFLRSECHADIFSDNLRKMQDLFPLFRLFPWCIGNPAKNLWCIFLWKQLTSFLYNKHLHVLR